MTRLRSKLPITGLTDREKDRPRVPVWTLSIVVLVVVMPAALAERRLDEYEHSPPRTQTLLFSIEEDAAELALGEYQAIREKEITPEIAEDVAENRREIEEALDELERLDPRSERPARISEEVSRYQALVN